MIHINADGGDGGRLAAGSRVSAQREVMARYVAGLTNGKERNPIGGNMAADTYRIGDGHGGAGAGQRRFAAR